MKQTIKEIKDQLATIDNMDDIQHLPFYKDERIGVQKAIATRIKPVSYTHLTLPTIYSV